MGRRAQEIELTEAQKQILEHFSARRSQPYSLVQRAKVILEAATGEQNKRIGAHLGMHARHVQKWRVRWAEQVERLGVINTATELEAAIQGVLRDRPRPGCPPTFSAEQMCRIIELACRQPEALGYPVNSWTPKELAREAVQQGIVEGISPRTVGRFLNPGRLAAAPVPVLAQRGPGSRPAGLRHQSRRDQ